MRAALNSLVITAERPPAHLSEEDRQLRRGLRAKARQLGDQGDNLDLLIAECAYEQWHRLLFARFLAENNLLIHPKYRAPVTLEDCEELAESLGEPDGWAVAGRFAAEILPGIFRIDDPCNQLRLAPEGRLALEAVVGSLSHEILTADDSLGWVYQFWQREQKDEVNRSERKIGGADIGPVTQLFTENYMVRFLLENSLGAWWASRFPSSQLVEGWDFLLRDELGHPATGSHNGWPDTVAQVTVIDPCCGSGHFLVEAFEMLWRMRVEEEGVSPVIAQDAVLRENLFGLELDPRCVQIAMFSLALQAWKSGGGWRELPVPQVACSGMPVKSPLDEWSELADGDARLEAALARLHVLYGEADSLGSLLDPRRVAERSGTQGSFDSADWAEIGPLLATGLRRERADPASAVLGAEAVGLARATSFLARSYTLVVTNPPFLTRQRQTDQIRGFLDGSGFLGSADLATAFSERCRALVDRSGTVGLVGPLGGFFQPAYRKLREARLGDSTWDAIARLGPRAFEAISGEVVSVALTIVSARVPEDDHEVVCVDALEASSPSGKRLALAGGTYERVAQKRWLRLAGSRIVLGERNEGEPLHDVARSLTGTRTGDNPRLLHRFWEHQDLRDWRRLQSVPSSTSEYAGREGVVLWQAGQGVLAEFVKTTQASIQGMDAWGRRGVCLGLTGDIKATIYTGEIFDMNCGVVWPRSDKDLLALWAYLKDPEYAREVRQLDQQLKLTTKTLVEVPFDRARWTLAADREYPDGLPDPWSNDPTQWLFQGRPETATEPLQVGIGRMLGYRWPDQPEWDDLDALSDDDGIVCLPSVRGERTAAERLQELLSLAFNGTWSPARTQELLSAAGSKKQDLDHWLRDEFFKAHCQVFKNRPFVWHVWDGRKDGFAALVNYHRLNRPTLEKLTFSYLGDWIERQTAGVRDDVAGAEERLAAARSLQQKLELILEGEPPYDVYVRWKSLAEQPIGWEPDLNDGVRLNVRPFVEAGVLRSKFNVKWDKDRGKNTDGTERINDLHYTHAEKRAARGESA